MASCHTHAATKLSSHRSHTHAEASGAKYSPTDCGHAQIRRVWHPAIPTQPLNYFPTEHTETTGGEEKSVGICEIRGRLFSAISFWVLRVLWENHTQPNHLWASVRICGRLFSARSFCGFGEFCGRTSEGGVGMAGMPYPPTSVKICEIRGRIVMLVQRRPLHPLKIATPQQQCCHATTTMLPRYDNKIATLRQQGCHATAKCRETDGR